MIDDVVEKAITRPSSNVINCKEARSMICIICDLVSYDC